MDLITVLVTPVIEVPPMVICTKSLFALCNVKINQMLPYDSSTSLTPQHLSMSWPQVFDTNPAAYIGHDPLDRGFNLFVYYVVQFDSFL